MKNKTVKIFSIVYRVIEFKHDKITTGYNNQIN